MSLSNTQYFGLFAGRGKSDLSIALTSTLRFLNSKIFFVYSAQEALPDECLASIEIGRRGWEFSTQYIFKRRPRSKTVIYPDLGLVKNRLMQSLEELHIDVPDLDEWIDILLEVKKSKSKYRFSTSEAQRYHSEGLFSKFYKNKYTLVHEYL